MDQHAMPDYERLHPGEHSENGTEWCGAYVIKYAVFEKSPGKYRASVAMLRDRDANGNYIAPYEVLVYTATYTDILETQEFARNTRKQFRVYVEEGSIK